MLVKKKFLTANIFIIFKAGFKSRINSVSLINFTMYIWPTSCQDIKIVPFNIMTRGSNVISNGWSVTVFSKGLKMFSFSAVEKNWTF